MLEQNDRASKPITIESNDGGLFLHISFELVRTEKYEAPFQIPSSLPNWVFSCGVDGFCLLLMFSLWRWIDAEGFSFLPAHFYCLHRTPIVMMTACHFQAAPDVCVVACLLALLCAGTPLLLHELISTPQGQGWEQNPGSLLWTIRRISGLVLELRIVNAAWRLLFQYGSNLTSLREVGQRGRWPEFLTLGARIIFWFWHFTATHCIPLYNCIPGIASGRTKGTPCVHCTLPPLGSTTILGASPLTKLLPSDLLQ